MITFETQEDFNKAVMAAVEKLLKVQVFIYNRSMGQEKAVEVQLINRLSGQLFSKDEDQS